MDVLVISNAQDVIGLISKALSEKVVVEHATSVSTALEIYQQNPYDIIFTDLKPLESEISTENFSEAIKPFKKYNPNVKIVVLTSKTDIRRAVYAVKNGAENYLTYPIDGEEVLLVFNSIEDLRVKDLELDYLRDRFWKKEWLDIIHSKNPVMREVFKSIRSVAPTIANVLLLGETLFTDTVVDTKIRSSAFTAAQFRTHSLRANCSDMKKVHLQVLIEGSWANLKWHEAELFFWMKLVRLRHPPRLSCCRYCKTVHSAVSVVQRNSKQMLASFPQPMKI